MRKRNTYLVFFLLVSYLFVAVYPQKLRKRTSFKIPLVKLRVVTPKNDPESKNVQVAIDGNEEYAIISRQNDIHIKLTRQGKEKITYAESQAAYALSDWEAKQFKRIIQSLIATLELFENDLGKRQWGRCLYLDSFFPRFMKGFYYFNVAAFNSSTALPKETNISDALFDISLNSSKSDKRIGRWLEKKDYIVKLRIITKELVYQLKTWQKKELNNYKKKIHVEFSDNLKETYSLFVRMYFNQY